MKKINYFKTTIGLYLNYFMYGMQSIIISQNSYYFIKKWNTDLTGIMKIIAYIGLGKLLSIWVSGELSDRYGRKLMIQLGMSGIIIFLIGLIFCSNYKLAMFFVIMSGISVSMLDSGTYPALQEAYSKKPGSALVAIKGFMSLGQMIFPLFVGVIVAKQLWACWSLILPLTILLTNYIYMLRGSYPYDDKLKLIKKEKSNNELKETLKIENLDNSINNINDSKFYIEGICCILYGFVALTTFYLVSQILTIYGLDYIGMSDMASRALISYYTIGSVLAVLSVSFIISRGIKPLFILLIFNIAATVFLILLSSIQNTIMAIIGSFAIGFFAAGGNLQMGIAVIGEFFPNKKGRNIGLYYTFMGLGSYISPLVASKLMTINFKYVLYFNTIVSLTGVILMIILCIRYKKIFKKSVFLKSKS